MYVGGQDLKIEEADDGTPIATYWNKTGSVDDETLELHIEVNRVQTDWEG